MHNNETIDDMITRFTKITNKFSFLGDSIDNDKKVRRVIQALPQSWEVKSTTLKELNDKEEIDFMGLIENLKPMRLNEKWKKKRHCKIRKALHLKPLLPSPMKMKILSKMMMNMLAQDYNHELLFWWLQNS